MPRTACPSCQRTLRVPDTVRLGKRVRCPQCGTIFPMLGHLESTGKMPDLVPKPAANVMEKTKARPNDGQLEQKPVRPTDSVKIGPNRNRKGPGWKLWVPVGVGGGLLLFVLALVAIGLMIGSAGPRAADFSWQLYSSTLGQFEVLLPGSPQQSQQREPVGNNQFVTTYYTRLELPAHRLRFEVAYVDLPTRVPADRLDLFLNEMATQAPETYPGSKIDRIEPSKLSGKQAREYLLSLATGEKVVGKVTLVGVRSYVLTITGPALAGDHDMAKKFFDSFITKSPGTMPPNPIPIPSSAPKDSQAQKKPKPENSGLMTESKVVHLSDRDLPQAVAVAGDGKLCAAVFSPNSVKVFQTSDYKERGSFKLSGGLTSPLAFAPDGRMLAVGGLKGTVQLIDLEKMQELPSLQPMNERKAVTSLLFSREGKALYAIGTRVRVWDIQAKKELGTLPGQAPQDLALLGDGRLAGCWGTQIDVWDTEKRIQVSKVQLIAFPQKLAGCLIDRLAASDTAGSIWLCDPNNSEKPRQFQAHSSLLSALTASPDGRMIGSMAQGEICLWDAASGDCLASVKSPTLHGQGLAFFPDGRSLLSAAGNSLRVWDLSKLVTKRE